MGTLANSVQDQTEPYKEKMLHRVVQCSHREKEDFGSGAGIELQMSDSGVINSQKETEQNWVNRGAEETASSKNGFSESRGESDPRLKPLGFCTMTV